jgi:hypothetical protein
MIVGEGEHIPCYTPAFRDVRLKIVADDICDLDNLFGDTYSHKANPEIPQATLDRQREREIERVNRDGVWGIVGEYFDGEHWEHAGSCFGLIGEDWKNSGYDIEIMRATLDTAKQAKKCRVCHRPLKGDAI